MVGKVQYLNLFILSEKENKNELTSECYVMSNVPSTSYWERGQVSRPSVPNLFSLFNIALFHSKRFSHLKWEEKDTNLQCH